MSGYNQETGVFDLTITKAKYWHRRPLDPSLKVDPDSMFYFAALLYKAGLEVIAVKPAYLQVKATPEQIWPVLSSPSYTPKSAKPKLRTEF